MSVITQTYRPANERLLWGCVVASMLLHALLMWRMHGVESTAPVVQEFRATIRPAPAPVRPAPEPPKPEVAAPPEPPKVEPEPVKPPPPEPKKAEPVAPPKLVAPPTAKAAPAEKKATPQPEPIPAAPPPPASTTPDTSSAKGDTKPPVTPPAAPAAPAAGSSETKALIQSYELQLAQAAQKVKRYPSEAMQQGWEGTATVRVHIGANGLITGVEVVSGTGHDMLDEQAKTTATKAKPFVQIPAALKGTAFDAEIRVVFTLKQP